MSVPFCVGFNCRIVLIAVGVQCEKRCAQSAVDLRIARKFCQPYTEHMLKGGTQALVFRTSAGEDDVFGKADAIYHGRESPSDGFMDSTCDIGSRDSLVYVGDHFAFGKYRAGA